MINVQISEGCLGASGHNPVTTDSEIKIGTKIAKWHKPCLFFMIHSSAWILKWVETKMKVKYIVPGFKRTPQYLPAVGPFPSFSQASPLRTPVQLPLLDLGSPASLWHEDELTVFLTSGRISLMARVPYKYIPA